MKLLPKNVTATIVISRPWANLAGVRWFLRRGATADSIGSQNEVGHALIARILDGEDHHGLCVELNTEAHSKNPAIPKFTLLIPWLYVLAVVLIDPEHQERMDREIGTACDIEELNRMYNDLKPKDPELTFPPRLEDEGQSGG